MKKDSTSKLRDHTNPADKAEWRKFCDMLFKVLGKSDKSTKENKLNLKR